MGQGTAHLEQLPTPGEPETMRQSVVDLRGAEHPEVDRAAAPLGGVLQGRLHKGHLHTDPPVLGVHDHLQPPGGGEVRRARHLR